MTNVFQLNYDSRLKSWYDLRKSLENVDLEKLDYAVYSGINTKDLSFQYKNRNNLTYQTLADYIPIQIKEKITMTRKRLLDIINEEITKVKWGIVKEEITTEDEKLIRDIIRREVSAIFFDLFKKRKTWGA